MRAWGLAAVASAAGAGEARAAEPKNAITLEPLAVVFARTIAVEYERGFGAVGVHLGGAVTFGGFDSEAASGDYRAFAATLGVRIYPWSDAPIGAFGDLFGSLGWVSAASGDESAEGLGWSLGAMVGWTWVFGSVFALSLGAGAAYYAHDVDPDGGGSAQSEGRSGFFPVTRLGVGAAF